MLYGVKDMSVYSEKSIAFKNFWFQDKVNMSNSGNPSVGFQLQQLFSIKIITDLRWLCFVNHDPLIAFKVGLPHVHWTFNEAWKSIDY